MVERSSSDPMEVLCRVLRRSVRWVLTCAACALVGGCGGSAVTRSHALAYAHAINLRASDLPGWRPATPERVEHALKREARFAKCLGIHDDSGNVTVLSPLLAREEIRPRQQPHPEYSREAVASRVGIPLGSLPSLQKRRSGTAQETAVLASPQGRACIASYLRATFAPFHLNSLAVTGRPDPLNGLDGAVAYRFRIDGTQRELLEAGGYSIEIAPCPVPAGEKVPPHARIHCFPFRQYEDVVVLSQPANGTTVELYAGGSHLFSLQTERRLLLLLHHRAAAQKL